MTATETLRAMLDERGVEYEAPHAGFTIVRTDNAVCKFYETLEEPERGVFAVVTTDWLTPEQAIAATLGHSSNCTNSERTNAACKPTTYDNGYSADRVDPGDYYEFWEPACACGNCGELIPMRKFCPNCGCRLEVEA